MATARYDPYPPKRVVDSSWDLGPHRGPFFTPESVRRNTAITGTERDPGDCQARAFPEEENMLKTLAFATATIGLLISTASADYYIVQEKATKKCKVVETRPTESTWIQVGPAAFKTQAEAEKQIKTVCVEKR